MENITDHTLGYLSPEDRRIARLIEQRNPDWILELDDSDTWTITAGLLNGYVRSPVGGRISLRVWAPYRCCRHLMGLTAVVVFRSKRDRWRICADVDGADFLPQLRTRAEQLGVAVEVEEPAEGVLGGWVDASCAEEVARKLSAIRSGPDLTADEYRLRASRN